MILHITTQRQWAAAQQQGIYRGDTLESEGFIHCSLLGQVTRTASRYFTGQEGLLLLCIDEARVRAEIRHEDLYQAGETFPHIYGPLNLDAVTESLDFPPNADGTFTLPTSLQERGKTDV